MKKFFSIRKIRIATIIIINLFFVLSFRLDIQVLEGSLTGSRFLGFHLIDPFITIEVFLLQHFIPINLLIGVTTISIFYILFGGRIFCSWVCPYGLLSECGEAIHKYLLKKNIIKHSYSLGHIKYFFLILFLLAGVITGYLFFDIINMMSITSRLIIYGFTLSSILIFIMLLIEIFFARRVFCRSICPVGATYGLLNKISAGRITWDNSCTHCDKCRKVCFESRVMNAVDDAVANDKPTAILRSTDCTFCLRCVEVCQSGSLKYKNKIKEIV